MQRMAPRTGLVEGRRVSMGPTSAHSPSNRNRLTRVHPRSYLNLIRSVTTILDIMNRVMKEQDDRLRQQSSRPLLRSHRSGVMSSDDRELSDDDARDLVFDFSDKHKSLQLRLRPLASVQEALEMYLGSAAREPNKVGTTTHTLSPSPETKPSGSTHRHAEFFVSANSSWKTRLSGKEASRWFIDKDFINDPHAATEILNSCGSDIKQLWADNVVQQVLKGTKAQLEHSPGL